jgi:PAS domain S-box-containing protein
MITMGMLFNAVLKLSEPLPHVHDVSTRLQAQIVAVIALIVIFIFMPLSWITPLIAGGLTPISIILRLLAAVSAVGIFLLARHGYVRASADALTGVGYSTLWCIAVFGYVGYIGVLKTLDLFVIITLLSTVVMPIRRAMVWWMLSFPLLLAVPLLRPDVPLRLLYGGTVLFHLAAGGTAIVVVGLLRRGERLMRDAAQARERELKTLMNHLPDYIVRVDTEFRYLFANKASQALLETPVEALTGRSPDEVLSRIQNGSIHGAIEQWRKVVEETIRTGKVQRAEIKAEGEGGFLLWFDIICAPEFDSRGKVASVLVVARDTTERRENEEALKASRALIQRIADTLPHMMFVFDPDPPPRGKLIFANRAMLTFFGCETKEEIPPSDSSPIPCLHPDDLKPLFDYFAARAEQAEQTPETIEVRLRRADGEWRWVRFWVFNFDDPQLKTGRMMGMIADVTEERRMRDALIEQERERTRAEAERQLNHLKTQMMIRIADQFRNPLAAIHSASDMLERYYDRMSETQRSERFDQIKTQVTQITGLLDNMGAVLRQQDNQPEREQKPVRLSRLGVEILDEMRARYGDCHRVQFICDRDAQTLINQESLRLILTHLLSNAFLYTPAGGEVTLEIHANDMELMLIVRDTGIGIEEVDGMRVFDPFYRGSNIDERPGLGLGLSIVRSQVLAHSGFIQLVSDTKIGTTVTVRLPNQRVLESKMSGA